MDAGRRGPRMVRTGALAVLLVGVALALAACTFTSPHPTAIRKGVTIGQAVGPLTFRMQTTTADGTAVTSLKFSVVTGSGTVVLTRTADRDVRPTTTGSFHATGPCTPTRTTFSTLVCPELVATGPGTKSLTFSGIKVSSFAPSGKVEATFVINGFGFTTIAATYVTPPDYSIGTTTTPTAPTFASADSTTFTAGHPGTFPVRVHGSPSTLSLSGAPSWLSVAPHSGFLEGSPPANAAGHYRFTIIASTDPKTTRQHGDDLTARQSFTLTVVRP
jgi:Putative Ig domain